MISPALDDPPDPFPDGARTTAAGDLDSDQNLVDAVRRGDIARFELLMRRYNQRVYRSVRAVLRNESEIEEVLQEAWVRAFTHLDQFAGRASFSTWLIRIALHEAYRRMKKQTRLTDMSSVAERLEAAEAPPERTVFEQELRVFLERAIDRLPESFRAVVMLRDVEGLTTLETAEALEIPLDTAKTRLHRARAQLRRDIDRALGTNVREVFAFGNHRCDRLVAAVLGRIRGVA
ncbi:MAG TPA: RNA polymerase sigma factor [Terriglobales bacterium]|nr:RNA polymerase sigma factor [Terriglobales bacterium]